MAHKRGSVFCSNDLCLVLALKVLSLGGVALSRCMGHNRGWEEAASQLSGVAVELKTANAALLEAPGGSWKEVSKVMAMQQSTRFIGFAVAISIAKVDSRILGIYYC